MMFRFSVLVALTLTSAFAFADANAEMKAQLDALTAKVKLLEANATQVVKVPIKSWVGAPTVNGQEVEMISYEFTLAVKSNVLVVLDGNVDLRTCYSTPGACGGSGHYGAPMQMNGKILDINNPRNPIARVDRSQMNAMNSSGQHPVGSENVMSYSHNMSGTLAPGKYRLQFSVLRNDIGAIAARLYNASMVIAPAP